VVIFGTEMPSTSVGKIRRGALAQQLAGELARFWDSSFRTGNTKENNPTASIPQAQPRTDGRAAL
jgi:hypothetical protein